MKIALITGVTGQDGSYLVELLLSKGYEVHGIVRRSSMIDRARIDHLTSNPELYNKFFYLHYCDLEDLTTLRRLLIKINPTEFYHLAGQSHVGLSFEIPESTCEFTAMATLRILEMLRDQKNPPKFLNIGSSEIFGSPEISPQNERTPMRPVSPYGAAKAFAVNMTRIYRESFGLFACTAICYNHESERRSPNFVTRKITQAVARIKLGESIRLPLGNIDIRRDWGYAPEYVEAMWLMMQQDYPTDLIISTGKTTYLREFLKYAFEYVDLSWEDYVDLDERFVRPIESIGLVGDPSQAKKIIGWQSKVSCEEMISIMIDHDLCRTKL
jgi:GDPmannose 4,6-dehydratase